MTGEALKGTLTRRASSIVLPVFGLGIATCAILAMWLGSVEKREAELLFQRRAQAPLDAFANGLSDAEEALVMVNQLFAVSPQVSRAQFEQFTQPLLQRHPYIQAFGFQRLVTHAQRPQYEAMQRRQFPDFSIREIRDGKLVKAGERPRYRVAEYVSPVAGNERVLGLDAASQASQDLAVLLTEASGRPAASGLFRLVQEPAQQPGFTMVMAVYGGASVTARNGTSGNDIVGYTVAAFRAGDLADKLLHQDGILASETLDIALYHGEIADEQQLVYRSRGKLAATWMELPAWWRMNDADLHSVSRVFNAGGQQWLMLVTPAAGAAFLPHTSSWLVLATGSLVTLLFVAYILALVRRTSDLSEANEALQRSQHELRELASHQERVKEDERKRIAREIHDDLGQNLLALRIDVTLLEKRVSEDFPVLHGAVQALLRQIDVTVRSVRAIINNLRPGVLDLGLHAAIEWQVRQLNERYRTVFCLTKETEVFGDTLDDDSATTIFRIVQESLTNVVRHANASRADIRLSENQGRLRILIADNGVGSFPGDQRKPRSYGLVGIKERTAALGGEFRMESVRDQGTTLIFDIPVSALKDAHSAHAGGSERPERRSSAQ